MEDTFSNRELANITWIFLFGIFTLSNSEFRSGVRSLFALVLQKPLFTVFALQLVYTALIVLILKYLNLWNLSLLKATIIWWCGSIFILLNRSINDASDAKFSSVSLWVKDNIAIVVLVSFIVDKYTFSYLIELVLVPLAILITLVKLISDREENLKGFSNFCDIILTAFGLFLFYRAAYFVINSSETLWQFKTLNELVLVPLLSLLFIPFQYFLYLYLSYENAFLPLSFYIDDTKLRSYTKQQVMLSFASDMQALWHWKKKVESEKPRSKLEVDEQIQKIKTIRAREKNPPEVPWNEGWSPYAALNFLKGCGLKGSNYRETYDSWSSVSQAIELNDEIMPDNITFYIRGNENSAQELKLVLNVNNLDKRKTSYNDFSALALELIKSSVSTEEAERIHKKVFKSKRKKAKENGRSLLLEIDNWENGLTYTLKVQVYNP